MRMLFSNKCKFLSQDELWDPQFVNKKNWVLQRTIWMDMYQSVSWSNFFDEFLLTAVKFYCACLKFLQKDEAILFISAAWRVLELRIGRGPRAFWQWCGSHVECAGIGRDSKETHVKEQRFGWVTAHAQVRGRGALLLCLVHGLVMNRIRQWL